MIVLMTAEERKNYPLADFANISFGHGEKGHPKAVCGYAAEVNVYDTDQVNIDKLILPYNT